MSEYNSFEVNYILAKRIRDLSTRNEISFSDTETGEERKNVLLFVKNQLGKHYKNSDDATLSQVSPSPVDFSRWLAAIEKQDKGTSQNPPKKMTNIFVIKSIAEFIEEYHDTDDQAFATAFAETVEQAKSKPIIEEPRQDAEAKAEPAVEVRPLLASLRNFETTCNTYLLFPPFTGSALSLHLTFASFYAVFALILMWAIYGISGFGDVQLLPVSDVPVDDPRSELDPDAMVENRFFILSAVAVVVMIAAAGALLAGTPILADARRSIVYQLQEHDVAFAVAVSSISGAAMVLSGMHPSFGVLYAVMMTGSILFAGRGDLKRLVSAAYPFAILTSIIMVIALAQIFGSILGAGGVLPIISFFCFMIGAFSKGSNATVVAGMMTLICSIILAALNYVMFKGAWFRIDPWDPGTTLVFLVIPLANGFWDWISMSTTRKLSSWAINATEEEKSSSVSLRLYLAFVLMDIVAAFLTIIMLYLTLYWLFDAYNALSGENASLEEYFRGFQESLMADTALLVVIMLITVLFPTAFHVHMVCRSILATKGAKAIFASLTYLIAMVGSLALLLTVARGVLKLLYPAG